MTEGAKERSVILNEVKDLARSSARSGDELLRLHYGQQIGATNDLDRRVFEH